MTSDGVFLALFTSDDLAAELSCFDYFVISLLQSGL
jgi:hypothetical protein